MGAIPLLVRRGGCGIKKISAKPTLAPQTGWSLTQTISLERPPRRFAPPLLTEEGSFAYLLLAVAVALIFSSPSFAQDRAFLNQRIAASYNSQCCGISFDWQSITSPLFRSGADRRFGLSFTLAGIGSFSNPLGSFGGQ